MFRAKDRVFETSNTIGTGAYQLLGAPTGFQPFSVFTAADVVPYFATDDINWEVGLGTYSIGPAALARTRILASSNANLEVDWPGGTTQKIRCGHPAGLAYPRALSKSVAGGVDVALTQDEQRRGIIELTGILTGNIAVTVDATPWEWIVSNKTTGAFALVFKVAGQAGVVVTQGKTQSLYCNGTDVFSAVTEGATIIRGHLSGGVFSNNAGDATNDLDFTAFSARDSTDAVEIIVPAMAGKRLDAGFAAGPGGGMRSAAEAISDKFWYLYAIRKDSDGSGDWLADPHASAPTMPAGYTYFRRGGVIERVSGALRPVSVQEVTGGGLEVAFTTGVEDYDSNTWTTARVLMTLSVPANMLAKFRANAFRSGVSITYIVLQRVGEADAAPSFSAVPGTSLITPGDGFLATGEFAVRVNASRQIAARSTETGTEGQIVTIGYVDDRRS